MALIKCKECGQMISDKAVKCPKCGCPIQEEGRRYQEYAATNAPVYYEKKNNSQTWLYAVIAFLATAVLACGAFFLLNDKKNDVSDNSNPITTAAEEGFSASPTSEDQEVPATANPVMRNKVANGTYRLKGAITHKQNYYIDMEIHVNGNQVSGQYIVSNGENVYVSLIGSIDAYGNMRLTEYKDGNATGYYFQGKFNQSKYSGKYHCTYRKLKMNFSASVY